MLERDRIGGADTASTTAHLTYVTDLRAARLVSSCGEDAAALVWEACAVAIDAIEGIAGECGIDCDLRRVPGYLHSPCNSTSDETDELKQETRLARKLGFAAKFEASVRCMQRPGICFPDQAKFHPLKYLAGLAKEIEGDGSSIFEGAEVSEFHDHPRHVTAGNYVIRANHFVIATHVPLMGRMGFVSATLFQAKLFPYLSYVVGATIPRGLVPEAIYWDTAQPYHYLRVETGESLDYVIFGGEDHKTGQEDDPETCFSRLEATLQALIPAARVEYRWSGQVIETDDSPPYIGETAEHQFVATGFAGNGMTFGTLSALMARDAVLGRDNPWKSLFAIDRANIHRGAWRYLTENIDFPFYYVKDRLRQVEGKSTEDVRAGEGKILELNGQGVACSRDALGNLSTVSPWCTHMGCLVHWNAAEKTWDCPCHGSRFQPDGTVLAGPAESPLDPH